MNHYHSESHIQKLREYCARKCGDIWRSPGHDTDEMNVDEICIDLDATDDHELSQYSHFSSLEFSCGCCDQRFKSEAALRAHL